MCNLDQTITLSRSFVWIADWNIHSSGDNVRRRDDRDKHANLSQSILKLLPDDILSILSLRNCDPCLQVFLSSSNADLRDRVQQ